MLWPILIFSVVIRVYAEPGVTYAQYFSACLKPLQDQAVAACNATCSAHSTSGPQEAADNASCYAKCAQTTNQPSSQMSESCKSYAESHYYGEKSAGKIALDSKPQVQPKPPENDEDDPAPTGKTQSTLSKISASTPKSPSSNTTLTHKNQSSTSPSQTPTTDQPTNIDISACQSAQSTAQSCCGSPAKCLQGQQQTQYNQDMSQMNAQTPSASNSQSGVSGSCEQMQAASAASQDANNLLAGVCSDKQCTCKRTCQQLLTQNQNALANCSDCANQSALQNAVSSLNDAIQRCGNLSAQLTNLSGQGTTGAYGSAGGMNCAQPASSGGGAGGAPSAAANANTAGGASSGAGDAGQTSAAATATAKGQAGLLAAPSTSNKFDLGDSADGMQGVTKQLGGGAFGTPPKVNEISNNSGGGMQGGGGGGHPAAAGAGPARGGSPGSAGYSTDIEHGVRSGGYTPGSGGGYVTENAAALTANAIAAARTLDLRQFLPGGSRDPASINGPAALRAAAGIGGPHVDIWGRITDRIQLKCRLGELFDCN